MKGYEGAEAQRRLDPQCPIVARIDGRTFSKFTKGFQKPFDPMLTYAMDQTTRMLVQDTHAAIGYTQSDEITLIWPDVEGDSGRFFDGRVQKLASVLAAQATVEFVFGMLEYAALNQRLREGSKTQVYKPHFDCRVWSVPDRDEATNTLLWRAQDAKKNAVSSFARQYISHRKMQGLDQAEMLEAAHAAGAPDFDSTIPVGDRFGRFYQRVTRERRLTDDEWWAIPEDRRPPRDIEFKRSSVERLQIGYFGQFAAHESRKALIFGAAA